MANFVSRGGPRHEIDYERVYQYRDGDGGFSFPCNSDGVIDEARLQPVGLVNLRKCRSGQYDVIDLGVREYHRRWVEPSVIRCSYCGQHVELAAFTNTCCRCGADYNMSGQCLGPRHQWGEETGEHWTQCL